MLGDRAISFHIPNFAHVLKDSNIYTSIPGVCSKKLDNNDSLKSYNC